MSDPVTLLANAIATREGFFVMGTTPNIRDNPGDLRYAGQAGATCPTCKLSGGAMRRCTSSDGIHAIADFGSLALGTNALHRDLRAKVATGVTVRKLIEQFAPPNENDTSSYLSDVLNWTGLPPDIPVLDLLPRLVQMNAPRT